MRILFLAHRVPYPPDRGDKIATWNFVSHMRRGGHDVHIVCFAHDERDDRAARDLQGMGYPIETFRPRSRWRSLTSLLGSKPITLTVYGSDELQACVDERVRESDLVYAYSSSMGAFLIHHTLPRLMHFAELDSDKWRQYAEYTGLLGRWIYRREARTLFEFETRLAHSVEESIVCTPLEKDILERCIPGVTAEVVPNGVDVDAFHPDQWREEADHLVFVGMMDYYPNVDGCIWFCEEVMPLLLAERPSVRFSIVGANPTPRVRKLAELPGVEVTGRVDDPRDWLKRASIAIAPLRIARGIQNKVLESLAMGLPVVGTTSSTQGLLGREGHDYLLEDEAEGQARTLLALLADDERRHELARRGRAFVEANFPWDHVLAAMDRLLAKHGPPAAT